MGEISSWIKTIRWQVNGHAETTLPLTSTGNLFTEKIDKRDVFYIFHKYGTLAQISLKSAYGFVQFLDVQDCSRAIQCEQGLQIRGRKISENPEDAAQLGGCH